MLEGPVVLYGVLIAVVVLLLVVRRFSADPALRRRAALVSALLMLFVLLQVWLPAIPQTVERMVERTPGGVLTPEDVANPLYVTVSVVRLVVALLAALLLAALAIVDLFFVRRLRAEVPKILPDVAVLTLFFFGVLLILYYRTTLDITGLFTTSALITVVIGLALQDTLGNLFAGLALQSERSFRVGDWVRFGTYEGVVSDVSWRATKIRTRDNDLVIVPNTVIGKDVLLNYSAPSSVHALTSEVGCHYRHPPGQVIAVLEEAAAETEGVLARPRPQVRTIGYGDFAITYQLRYWVRDVSQEPEIRSDLMSRIWYVFDRHGIEIPFPIRNVFLREEISGAAEASRDEELARIGARLRRCDLFDAIGDDELTRLAKRVRIERYFTGEIVLRQGEPGDSLYVIDEGRVEVLLRTGENQESRLAELSTGSFFGEMSMMVDEPRSATVRTRAPTRFLVVNREAFKETLQSNPAIAARLSETLAARKKEQDLARETHGDEPVEAEERRILHRIRQLFGF
jgi:small-conductance mechanosensitive channel/CRP-like cAMP-binding protein